MFGVFMKAAGGRNDGDPDARGGLLMHFVWWVCRSFSWRWEIRNLWAMIC